MSTSFQLGRLAWQKSYLWIKITLTQNSQHSIHPSLNNYHPYYQLPTSLNDEIDLGRKPFSLGPPRRPVLPNKSPGWILADERGEHDDGDDDGDDGDGNDDDGDDDA